MSPASPRVVQAPRPPELPPRPRVPLVATLAPLVLAVVLFAVTRSPLTLAFAALGPVVAGASLFDAILSRRRIGHREASRFHNDAERVRLDIESMHAEAADGDPESVADLLRQPESVLTRSVLARWAGVTQQVRIRIGCGSVRSSLTLESTPHISTIVHPAVLESLSMLEHIAEWRESAAVTIEPEIGVAIVGIGPASRSLLRAIVLQAAATLPPSEWRIVRPPSAEDWMDALPHDCIHELSSEVRFISESLELRIVAVETLTAVPRELDVVLAVSSDGSARHETDEFQPELVSLEQAGVAALALRHIAERAGVLPSGASALSESVALRDLEAVTSTDRRLAVAVGATIGGPFILDLASDGPHAIVGGTTGSGKSELLLSWILGMASTHPPDALGILFVDFKGGASFGPLTDLAHSVGVLTDLDAEQAIRAIESLSAELRHRERRLAERGLRSIDEGDVSPFARLVVVVDEYAALVERFPDLHAIFADIAARGRSLGVHLILCTQRPAGVVRDSILANCALRISLRVTTAADSVAVIGSPAAADLPFRPLGRALASVGGSPPVEFQVALSDRADVDRVLGLWSTASRSRSPWLPPLPATLGLAVLDGTRQPGEVAFALADLPAEQAQRPAFFRPRSHGSLLVVGAAGSGKTGVLAALAASTSDFDVRRLPSDLPRLWDALTGESLEVPDPAAADRLLLLDDVDAVLARCPDSHQTAVVDLLARLLRDGPAARAWCVLTAQRSGGVLHGLGALCGSQLVLRMPNRAEHALAAVEAPPFLPGLPPGGGFWQGARVQVAMAPRADEPERPLRSIDVDVRAERIVVVSAHPDAFRDTIAALAPGRRIVPLEPPGFGVAAQRLDVFVGDLPPILIADPELWQAQWSLFASLQRTIAVVFDGCSLAEIRMLTRSRELPPPFPPGVRPLWIRSAAGKLQRASLRGEKPVGETPIGQNPAG